jgi:uncharacterized membrane protein
MFHIKPSTVQLYLELLMYKSILNAAALATVLSAAVSTPAFAQDSGKEKCFGIATAGKNDCANLSGSHSCAGEAKADKEVGEWKYVNKGECAKLGGLSKADAEAKIKAMTAKKA